MDSRPTILITGIAGNLGSRLLPILPEFNIIGVDLAPIPKAANLIPHQLDLSRENSCIQLVRILRESRAQAIVHLAFAVDPLRVVGADHDRTWQTNVVGTARVMEAISEVNRRGDEILKFIHVGSAASYGSETPPMVDEAVPLASHPLAPLSQKTEADAVVRFRASSMGNCSTYLLRPHNCAGAAIDNYLVNAIRGCALGAGKVAKRLQRKQKKLPFLLPMGPEYLRKLQQFVHVDDLARLIAWLLHRPNQYETLTLNVAGSGTPVTIKECAEIAGTPILRLPSIGLCTKVQRFLWNRGISTIPPEALPYLIGSTTVSTRRLKELLGTDYDRVIQYTSKDALRSALPQSESF